MKKAEEVVQMNPNTQYMSVEEMMDKVDKEVTLAALAGNTKTEVRLGCSCHDDVEIVMKQLKSLGYGVEHYYWHDYDISVVMLQELIVSWW